MNATDRTRKRSSNRDLKLKPALYKDAGRFLIERGWDAEGDAVHLAVNILNAGPKGEFIKVISHTERSLI